MNWRDHITTDPDVLHGKPAIRGTRISVGLIVGWLAQGWSHELLLESYPGLTNEDILASLAYAVAVIDDEATLATSKAAG